MTDECGPNCIFGRVYVPSWSAKWPARLVVVCEAPGYREVEQLTPLIGPAGNLFNRFLEAAGAERKDCFLANTVCCVDLKRDDRRPTPAEMEACQPRLLSEITMSGAPAIVAMGNISQQLFFPGNTVSKIQGGVRAWPHPVTGKVYPVVSTYHPAYALHHRSPQVAPLIIEDLKTALSFS